jgi:hypothetical protein
MSVTLLPKYILPNLITIMIYGILLTFACFVLYQSISRGESNIGILSCKIILHVMVMNMRCDISFALNYQHFSVIRKYILRALTGKI